MLASILCILLAASAGHRAKAERFEALGRMAEAAREYESAWDEEQSPELLYRLGIVRGSRLFVTIPWIFRTVIPETHGCEKDCK